MSCFAKPYRLTDTMPYSRATMQADIQALGTSSWDWAGDKPGRLNPVLVKKNPNLAWGNMAPKDVFLEEITEYCWRAYEAAQRTAGHQVVGRVKDLEAADLYKKVGEVVGDATLFDDPTVGNLLKMDKWARVVNDSWILGGVHRHSLFRLVSPRISKNLWDDQKGYLVVTARELLGLLNFGYALEQVGPWQILSCKDKNTASSATLIGYEKIIKEKGSSAKDAYTLLQQVTGVVAPDQLKLAPRSTPQIPLKKIPAR